VLICGRVWHPTRRSVAVAAGLGVAAIAFYVSPAGWNLHSRVRWFREDPRGGARLQLWRDTLAMSLHRLPTGFGPEVFTAQFPHYESEQLPESYPDFAHESPHNMFLDALVAGGLPGLVILGAMALCAGEPEQSLSKDAIWCAAAGGCLLVFG
jgi:O-antigen ligase